MALFLGGLSQPSLSSFDYCLDIGSLLIIYLENDVSAHCLLALANDDFWIAVVILVCCEGREYRLILFSLTKSLLINVFTILSGVVALGLLLLKSVQHARAMRNCACTFQNRIVRIPAVVKSSKPIVIVESSTQNLLTVMAQDGGCQFMNQFVV